jgi:TonB family protein
VFAKVIRQVLVCKIAISLLFSARLLTAQEPDPLLQRLRRAELATALTREGVSPFYLRIDVQLYDAKGKPSEKGTIEEWWAADSTEKTVFTTPSYTATEVRKGDEIFRSPGASYPPSLLKLLLDQVIGPMPSWNQIKDSKATLRTVKVSTVPLDCILLNLHSDPGGAPPEYCFDPGKDFLRLTYQYGERATIRNAVGTFQEKQVPIDVAVHFGNVMAATGHISALMSRPVPDTEVSTTGLTEKTFLVPPLGMKGALIHPVDVIYPDEAKRQHLAGTVVLRAVIGTDGHIRDLTAVSSPSTILTDASKNAVSRWVYRPYVVDGEPQRVETTISINFAIR